ncbi:cell division protein FtsL [Manganibacter manganicus]|uniref:Cell division protein FtsL n=1 Tax=Manganibacter manganicus TaxID=1873176 RepID=A0A1V8RW55_9HYPH|nr:hypothetical protein [Pseudaminobacter manganicus]OQM77344.1 hypothetical protein BFN67_00385 [Pseudaminobacter manganicus]
MFRTTDIILIAVMVSAAAMTYKIKRDAENQMEMVQKLQAQIHTEEDTIDLLKADWSLLTQPARLQQLTELYQDQLGLVPVDPHQFSGIDTLPVKPLTIEQLVARSGRVAGNGSDTDAIVTGSIGQ